MATALGDEGLFVWDGDFYATTLMRRLGFAEQGGMVRIGLAPYNTLEEIERVVAAVERITLGPVTLRRTRGRRWHASLSPREQGPAGALPAGLMQACARCRATSSPRRGSG